MRDLLRSLRRWALQRALVLLGERRRRIIAWQSMMASGVSSVSIRRGSLTWRVLVGDPHIGFGVFVDGGFADAAVISLLEWLAVNGRPVEHDGVFVDVGANIGTTCIPVVQRLGCRAVAIEPVPLNAQLLRENIAINGLADRIRVVETAITARPQRVRMAFSENSGAAAVLPEARGGDETESDRGVAEAEGQPLHEVLRAAAVGPSEVAIVWADVQGMETTVIETGTALWQAGVPLWAEFEPGLLARHGGVEAFYLAAEHHFDSFIELHQLLREGVTAKPREIRALRETLGTVELQSDVLLLPRMSGQPIP